LTLAAPTAVIPNGIFLDEVEPSAVSFATRPELGGQPYILFLSRLHYKKGLDILADAFRMIHARRLDLHLVVAGPDDGAQADFVKRIAGLASRAHLVGALHGREKWAALRDAAVFCLPSRQEGFSVAILEALASRTPVVISEPCHFPEVAEADAGTIVPLAAGAVADAVGRILADPGARRKMGDAGRSLVEKRFTWRRAAETSIAEYERILAD
jgi:glycosyltransferase involved in cell wall biosynthesis